MQGLPLQQSALDAHDAPASAHSAAGKAQRGTPTLSCLQPSAWHLSVQQSHVSLHVI
jgi:hypothetical protein